MRNLIRFMHVHVYIQTENGTIRGMTTLDWIIHVFPRRRRYTKISRLVYTVCNLQHLLQFHDHENEILHCILIKSLILHNWLKPFVYVHKKTALDSLNSAMNITYISRLNCMVQVCTCMEEILIRSEYLYCFIFWRLCKWLF